MPANVILAKFSRQAIGVHSCWARRERAPGKQHLTAHASHVLHPQKFFCWGYLVTGPNWKAAIGTGFVVVAPVVIYLTFVASYMTLQRSAAIMVFRWA